MNKLLVVFAAVLLLAGFYIYSNWRLVDDHGVPTWNFVKYSGNPIITKGAAYDIYMVDTTSAPVWDDVSHRWFIYYGGDSVNDKWTICLATSFDGVSWLKYEGNPVVDIASVGENTGAGDVSVLKDQGVWKMWFTYRLNTATQWQLGMATSNDGKTWILSPNNPLFLNGEGIYEPFVIKTASEYRLYYSTLGSIWFATSSDGVSWVNRGAIYDPSYDQFGPFPFKPTQSNYWYLFYAYHAQPGFTPIEIHYCISENGYSDFFNDTLIFTATASWETSYVLDPRIVEISPNKFYMYYQAGNTGQYAGGQIGLATYEITPQIL